MARIRTVKPEFWQHPKVTHVSRDARLLFIGLLNEADDEGRMRYSAKRLSGVLFGEDDDVTPRKFDRWVDELECVGLVKRYVVEDASLLVVIGFTEHQRINRPSESHLPEPAMNGNTLFTDESLKDHGAFTAGKEQGTGRARSATRATRIPEDFEVTPEMIEWVERECPGLDWRRHTQRFVNHWKSTSKNATKTDWRKTWDNWMLKEAG